MTTPPRLASQSGVPAAPAPRSSTGHWEWVEDQAAQKVVLAAPVSAGPPIQEVFNAPPQVVATEKIVPVYVDRLVEKPVYVDRPMYPQVQYQQMQMPQMQQWQQWQAQPMQWQQWQAPQMQQVPVPQMQQVPVPQVQPPQQPPAEQPQAQTTFTEQTAYQARDTRGSATLNTVAGQDHHHIIERPVYIEVDRGGDRAGATVIRDVEIVERPVYVQVPVPIPFERPVPVPVPPSKLMQDSKIMYEKQYGVGNDNFPYHNPYPEIGCDFTDRNLQASNEPDPLKAFLENFKPF